MICPKCKTKVSEKDVFCPKCNLRLIFYCPKCKSPIHLGEHSCKNCGYQFIKFCPECNSANFAWSKKCRKCSSSLEKKVNVDAQLKVENLPKLQAQKKTKLPFDISNPAKEVKLEAVKDNTDKPFLFYIDFINLDKAFERFNKDEFKQKVIQNIKTTVKIVFGANCDFVSSHCVMFKFHYTKQTNILKIIEEFNQEFAKFNDILAKTLDSGLAYKFAISTIDEVRKTKEVNQLRHGSDKDIIVSSDAYSKLSNNLSLIKISPDSYKMVFLDKKPVFEQTEDEKYDKTLEIILNNLQDKNSTVRAISINAPCGAGKTHLLDDLCYQISKANYPSTLLLSAKCSQLTQVSPFGLIQSFFISLFECPVVLDSAFNIKSFERTVLSKLNLDKIDEENLETLANLIYPLKKDYFENILINKDLTYKCLEDVFNYLKKQKQIIFVVDDFDLIDESSFGFLKYLVERDYFKNNAKLIVGYKSKHCISIYFQTTKLDNDNCLNISLRSLNASECKIFVKKVLGENSIIPNEILSQIAYNAQGNITYIEQIIQYMLERKILIFENKTIKFKNEYIDIEIPQTLEKCFEERLEFLKQTSRNEYVFLNIAALLGDSLNYDILTKTFYLKEEEYFNIVLSLAKKGYLKRKNQDNYYFKNSLTWSHCYAIAKKEELIRENANNLLLVLNNSIISSPLICPILAQITGNKELAFSLWTKSLTSASYIGDTNIYAMAQKQCLILLENVKIPNVEYVKNNILERLGKLIYKKSPQEAKDYLTNIIVTLEKQLEKNPQEKKEIVNKIIDLSGYLTKSLYLTQDYTGVVEVTDNIVKYFNKKEDQDKKCVYDLKIALIKTRKLQALLKLGSWEEIAVLVNTEINPILQKNLNFFTKHNWITCSEMVQIWFEANIVLAQSYAQQGSPMAMELINQIDKELSKEKDSKADYLKIRLDYANAMAQTAQGNFDESDAILQEIVTDYSYVIDEPTMVCEWNIISLINKILRNQFATIKDELFEATAYANNCGDEVSKNIIKTFLAYVLLEEKSYLKAIEIATNQMQYFSSKKIAFGALLAWYISAAATSRNKADTYCIEICEKAVKICENVQNNNHYFKVLFQELLAEIYFKLNDKDSAKMYCELALQTAQENDLYYMQIKLSLFKATIARELLNQQTEKEKYEYAQNVIKMYSRTLEQANRLNLVNLAKKTDKELTSFRAFCQLNRIIEDK